MSSNSLSSFNGWTRHGADMLWGAADLMLVVSALADFTRVRQVAVIASQLEDDDGLWAPLLSSHFPSLLTLDDVGGSVQPPERVGGNLLVIDRSGRFSARVRDQPGWFASHVIWLVVTEDERDVLLPPRYSFNNKQHGSAYSQLSTTKITLVT